jgi:uncharacterized protein (TIRG00374 family)
MTAPAPAAPEAPLLSPVLRRRLLLGLAFGLAVYAGLLLLGDGPQILRALRRFPLRWVAAACGLSFLNYCVRFLRWERYRALLGIRLSRWTSFRIYLSGLALTVTPGKLGEAFRAFLIEREDGTPVARSAPMVLAERFTDLLGFLILLAVGGIASRPDHRWVFWATLALCGVLLALVSSGRFATLLLRVAAKVPVVRRGVGALHHALESTRLLLAPRELLLPTVVSTLGWGLECYAFYLVSAALVPFGIDLLFATYTFAFSAILGAVAILFPGGLGVTEASMGTLLRSEYLAVGVASDTAAAKAASVTFVIRLCTLWFAVALGALALALHTRLARRAATATAQS